MLKYCSLFDNEMPLFTQKQQRHMRILSASLVKAVIILILPISFLCVIIIRALEPLIIIRLGILHSDRIGHFAADTELYIQELRAGINKPRNRFIDIFFAAELVCNNYLLKKWSEQIIVFPGFLLRGIYYINNCLPRSDIFKVPEITNTDRDVFNLVYSSECTIIFSADECSLGDSLINGLGIPQGAKFAVLTVRDSSYLDTFIPNRDWSYHSYRDSNIDNFILAAETLADLGFFVVRVGAKVNKEFNTKHSHIIDYACNGKRTEFLDLYLASKCEFCISTGTGYDALAHIFRRPIVFVNFLPIGHVKTYIKGLTIFSHHYSSRLKRNLSLQEIIDSNVMFIQRASEYRKLGIELHENSPNEIRDVCLEMLEILHNSHSLTFEDKLRQNRFWQLFPQSQLINGKPMHGKVISHIGRSFLEQNEYLVN